MRSGLVPSLNIINMETNRVSQLDETGSGYIFLNNMPLLLKAAIRRFKKEKGLGMSGFWLIETNYWKAKRAY
jgi:hypothetical protein